MPASEQKRIALVTGGTAGIGEVTARRLAEHGLRVIIVGRELERGNAAVERITRATGGAPVTFLPADLSDQRDIYRLSQRIGEVCPRLDVLVNNAGALFGRRRFSPQGIEMTFALNHLGYFQLTRLLLPMLEQSPEARIVNVASEAHRSVWLDFDNLQGEKTYNRWLAYKRSKLANLLFTYELARRLDGDAITVNAVHPGFVATNIGISNQFISPMIWQFATFAAISPEEGAKTGVFLATSADVSDISGQYFIKSERARSSPASYDAGVARRLWDESEQLIEMGGPSTLN